MTRPIKQAGFSVVELMVALTIGLILTAAVATLFINTNKTYNTQDDLARIQENARFAIEFITRDLRMAGYVGCTSNAPSDPGSVASNVSDSLEGINNAATTNAWAPSGTTFAPAVGGIATGTDAFTVRYFDPSVSTTVASQSSSTSFTVSDPTIFTDGEIVGISNCKQAEVFAVKCTESSSKCTNPIQSTVSLANYFSTAGDAPTIYAYTEHQYYVEDTSVTTSHIPGLYRVTNRTDQTSGELVQGVEDMQLLYGVDTDGDGVPNQYVTSAAVTAWNKVVTVQIGLLMRSNTEYGLNKDTATYSVLDTTFNDPSDLRVRRRVFTATVEKRNLQ